MNRISWNRGALLSAAGLLIFVSGCEYKAPASPWKEAESAVRVLPVINSVEPAEAGAASEITLIGENFADADSLNSVYFDDKPAVIKSATSTRITVLRPDVIGDSVRISVVVDGAVGIARFSPYKLDAVVENFGHFAALDAFLCTSVDAGERMTLAMGSTSFIRLNPDGSQDLGYVKTSATALWTDMATGPDGTIYAARSNNIIYRLVDDSASIQTHVSLTSRTDRVKTLAVGANGVIYGGGKNSDLLVIRGPGNVAKAGFYATWEIYCIRVWGAYVYVAAKYGGNGSVAVPVGIWRHAIQADGSLAEGELVLDWAASPIPSATIAAMALSGAGVFYIGSNDAGSPVITFDPASGAFSTLFYGIIPSPVDHLTWGSTTYLYAVVNRSKNTGSGGKLLRINTGVPGAQ
jgi:hypothetical protein